MIPSKQTLRLIAGDNAKRLRGILEMSSQQLESNLCKYPTAHKWYHDDIRPSIVQTKLMMASELLSASGTGFVNGGNSKQSPYLAYVDFNDPSRLTLIYVRGRFVINTLNYYLNSGGYPQGAHNA